MGNKTTTNKFHLVKWATICASTEHGGMGIIDPTLVNQEMGAKLAWKLRTNMNARWAHVLISKYRRGEVLSLSPQ